ncbi:MAG: hypothetical protein ACRENC_14585 [Gemmatimonadaceae bacterium]
MSIVEIAGAMSISEGAAKQTLFEARSSLHELTEGRAMECESVREAISLRDGRVLRGRRIRSHLRACAGCREFRAAIGARQADLRALAPPLPASAASAMLARLLAHGGSGGHTGGSVAASSAGGSLGGHVAAPVLAKGLAGVAVLAAATAGAVHLTAYPHRHRLPVTTSAAGGAGAQATVSQPGEGGGRAGLSSGRLRSHGPRTAGSTPHAQAKTSARKSTRGTAGSPRGAGVSGMPALPSARSVQNSPGKSPGNRAGIGRGRSRGTSGHRARGRESHPAAGYGSHSPSSNHSSSPPHEPAHRKPARGSQGETPHAAPNQGSASGEAPGHGAGGGEGHQQTPHETHGNQAPNATGSEMRSATSRASS